MSTRRKKTKLSNKTIPLSFVENSAQMSVDDAADALRVSNATIRNWVKTKYLRVDSSGNVLRASIEEFERDVAGIEKLTKRANKSQADSHDHAALQAEIVRALELQQDASESLSEKYESSLSDSFRNQEGIYYTPHQIAIQFFSHLPKDVSNLTFCDPCCGTGNYLLAAIEHGFSPENVYGFDTDPIALQIARNRFSAVTGVNPRTLKEADFLKAVCEGSKKERLECFDVIFTNPPWGKKLAKSDKTIKAKLLGAGKCLDTSALFFFASLKSLRPNGYLGLLLPEAFFNIATFQDARERALCYQIIALYDFGRPFKKLLTKAKGIVLQVRPSGKDCSVTCSTSNQIHKLKQSCFRQNPKSVINFSMSANECDALLHIFTFPHLTLTNYARWGLGIVTGNNSRYISDIPKVGYVPVYRGSDVHLERMTRPTAFISDDFSQYQQVAPLDLYRAPEKLIYRFISSDLVFHFDSEQRYVLNSANIFVLNESFPWSGEVLARYLSSSVINWIFKSLFQTHKVLRSDLEQLPLFTEFLSANVQFSEVRLLEYLGIRSDKNGSFRLKKKDM